MSAHIQRTWCHLWDSVTNRLLLCCLSLSFALSNLLALMKPAAMLAGWRGLHGEEPREASGQQLFRNWGLSPTACEELNRQHQWAGKLITSSWDKTKPCPDAWSTVDNEYGFKPLYIWEMYLYSIRQLMHRWSGPYKHSERDRWQVRWGPEPLWAGESCIWWDVWGESMLVLCFAG